jgi:AcrR family transcriptional regulator
MYHIKQDKRSQESARLITEGLAECMKDKDFERITITDVQKTSTVGRATFYRLFDSLPDVLSYQCDRIFDELLEKEIPGCSDVSEGVFRSLKFWISHADLLETIVKSSHLEILYQSHEKHAESLQNGIFSDSSRTEKTKRYLTGMLTSLMIGVLTVWIQNGREETADDLYEILMGISATLTGSKLNERQK